MRRAAIERILRDLEREKVDEEDAVDAAEPVVPLDETPVLPAFRRRADDIADEIGMGGAEADDAAAGIARGCLLYTSPSPRDVEESRMPSSA